MNPTIQTINNEVWATLAPSKIHGIGVFAIRDIPRGTELVKNQWDTETYYEVTDEEFMELLEPIRDIILDRTQQEEGVMIKFRHPNCMAKLQSFMNHSLEPNSDGQKPLKDIKESEEITENFLEIANIKLHQFTLERYKNEGII